MKVKGTNQNLKSVVNVNLMAAETKFAPKFENPEAKCSVQIFFFTLSQGYQQYVTSRVPPTALKCAPLSLNRAKCD